MKPQPGTKWLHNAWLITDIGNGRKRVEEVNVWGYNSRPSKGERYGEFWVKFPHQSEADWFLVHGSRLTRTHPQPFVSIPRTIKRET